jgi:ribonuclease HI
MRKSEILKNLRQLLSVFENDVQALLALHQLILKADAFPDGKKRDLTLKNNGVGSKNFPLPPELVGLSQGFAIFADGACRGNPGPGAWATIIQDSKGEVILKSTGVDVPTTNNKMELSGVIQGLKGLIDKWVDEGISGRQHPVFVFSDSKYVVEGIEKWVVGWKARGWKKADNKDPENLVLWKELDFLKSHFEQINFHWIKGHAGHPQNEMCDQMANFALDEAGF